MQKATSILVAIACGSVAVVLVLGLFNTWKGGDPNLSQKLMRWRIGLQFVAIVIIMSVLAVRDYWFHHHIPPTH